MWLDITWVIIAIIGFWKGWQKGLIISLFTSLAWLLGTLGAFKFCSEAAAYLSQRFDWHSPYVAVLAFVLVFIFIAFVVYLIGKALEKVVEIIQLGFVNRALGAVLKVLIYTLMFSLFVWLINQAGLIGPETKTQSKSFGLLLPVADHTISFVSAHIDAVKNIFNDLQHLFEQLAQKGAV